MVVEDRPEVARALVARMRGAFDTHVVHTLADAVAALTAGGYVGVFADLGLPNGDGGLSTVRTLRPLCRGPLIVVTGEDDGTLAEEAMLIGADGFLVKPRLGNMALIMRLAIAKRKASMTSPKVSAKEQTIQNLTTDMVQGGLQKLEAEQKARQKAKETHDAIRGAAKWLLSAIIPLSIGAYILVGMAKGGTGIVILVFIGLVFAVITAIPVALAVGTATAASNEFLKEYTENLSGIGGAVVRIVKAAKAKKEE